MPTFGHIALLLAGLLGASGVGLGAFGAHALKASLTPESRAVWQTASLYHLLHAAALAAVAAVAVSPTSPLVGGARAVALGGLSVGTLLFSGSLYALALGAPRGLGAVTPLGGVCLIVGWLGLVWAGAARHGG